MFWTLLAITICVGLVYVGYLLEPHYVSKRGDRFLCTGQWISPGGTVDGRKRELWVTVLGTGRLQVDVKRRRPRENATTWMIEGKAASPPTRRVVYVLRTVNTLGSTERMTINVPSRSRAVAILDAMLPNPRL